MEGRHTSLDEKYLEDALMVRGDHDIDGNFHGGLQDTTSRAG